MIKFNEIPVVGNEVKYMQEAISNGKICGDGPFTKKVHAWFEEQTKCEQALFTTSCTTAMEMSALLIDLKPGDEVIVPSYTFVSSALVYAMRGATIVFVDCRKDTMNIDETKIEAAITEKTKAIIPVHIAGVACEMDTIMDIANRHNIYVIEDAAQGVMCTYKGRPLGTIGHMGVFSFHETKNYSAGEGGLLLINDKNFIDRAHILREKGTNRTQFVQGIVDKYSWYDLGGSYLGSDLNAAYLYAQIEDPNLILNDRMNTWKMYDEALRGFDQLEVMDVPSECEHAAHMYFIKVKDKEERSKIISHMRENGVSVVFHYVPLHSSIGGQKYGRMHGEDVNTTIESERLLRLPLYYNMKKEDVLKVINSLKAFYEEK